MMLRFFASVIGCVAMLSGGLMGWVRYAQHDPEYSCLSFDNITVQLDTSLFMRHFYPLKNIRFGNNFSAAGNADVLVEVDLPYVSRVSPMPYFVPPTAAIKLSRLVLRNSADGSQRILETYEGEISFELSAWSLDKRYLAYAWEKEGEVLFKVIDTRGNIQLQLNLEDGNLRPIGWTRDNHYFLFFHFNHDSEDKIYSVDSQDWQVQGVEATQFAALLNEPDGFYYPRIKLAEIYAAIQSNSTIYVFDIPRQMLFTFPLPATMNMPELGWSPDGNKLLLSYIEPQAVPDTSAPYQHRMRLLTVAEHDLEEAATYTWESFRGANPLWSEKDSNYLYWIITDRRGKSSLMQYSLRLEKASIIATNISGFLMQISDYLLIGDNEPTYGFELWDIRQQALVHQQEMEAVFDIIPLSDHASFLYVRLSEDHTYDIYRFDLETLQEDLLFSSPAYPSMLYVTNRVFIAESNTWDSILFIDRIQQNTYAFDSTQLEPFTNLYTLDTQAQFMVAEDSIRGIATVYRISPEENTAQEIAVLEMASNQRITGLSLSPDEHYAALVIVDYLTNAKEIIAVSLAEGTLYPLGTFPYGELPIWTQCTY